MVISSITLCNVPVYDITSFISCNLVHQINNEILAVQFLFGSLGKFALAKNSEGTAVSSLLFWQYSTGSRFAGSRLILDSVDTHDW